LIVLNRYETQPAPPSSSTSLAGSVSTHLGILLIVLRVRSPLESHPTLQEQTAVQKRRTRSDVLETYIQELETFSVGQTIVISRGLLDVLPDEASLATALAGELAHIAPAYPNLIRANLGNQIAGREGLLRLQVLADHGPALDDKKLDQIAALSLGSRIRVDPWTNRIALLQAKPVSLLSARDKLPFEITPFMIPPSRLEAQPPASR
jgi:hypothetical protein